MLLEDARWKELDQTQIEAKIVYWKVRLEQCDFVLDSWLSARHDSILEGLSAMGFKKRTALWRVMAKHN